MDIFKANTKELPPGAKILVKDDAYTFLFNKIQDHQPIKDVWALKYGAPGIAIIASLSGVIMLKHFRTQLGLNREAVFSTFLPCAFIPCVGSFLSHLAFIAPGVILQEPHCEPCLQLKAGAFQFATGCVWPCLLGVTAAAMTANKVGFNVPQLLTLDFFRLSVKMARSGKGPAIFSGLLVLNVLGSMLIVYAGGIQMITFQKRLEIRRIVATEEQ